MGQLFFNYSAAVYTDLTDGKLKNKTPKGLSFPFKRFISKLRVF